jgi:hypothetical protein
MRIISTAAAVLFLLTPAYVALAQTATPPAPGVTAQDSGRQAQPGQKQAKQKMHRKSARNKKALRHKAAMHRKGKAHKASLRSKGASRKAQPTRKAKATSPQNKPASAY